MEHVRFGKSGLKVSRVCLGTMTFGHVADENTAFAIMDRFLEMGGSFVDTADQYNNGVSEEIVGRWMAQRGTRGQVILATKVYAPMGPGPNDTGLSRYHIQHAVEDSLRRLRTDVIDIYQIHRWDPTCPVEETVETLNDLVRQGKVRYLACSNVTAWQLLKYLHTSEQHHWSRFISLQLLYNALNRSVESEQLPLCEAEGLGVMVYNPLAGGLLSGKYRKGEPLPEGVRLQYWPVYFERYYTDKALDIVDGFVSAAAQRGVSAAQLALAWILAEPRGVVPIVGARNMEQFEDNMRSLDLKLTPEERDALPSVRPGQWEGVDQVYDRKY